MKGHVENCKRSLVTKPRGIQHEADGVPGPTPYLTVQMQCVPRPCNRAGPGAVWTLEWP